MKLALGLSLLILLAGGLVVALLWDGGDGTRAADPTAEATAFHDVYGNETATPGVGDRPLPLPGDLASGDVMSAAGLAMIEAARQMNRAADAMAGSAVSALVDAAGHWRLDAAALRERGLWMISSATSDSMVHDPSHRQQLNLESLRINGIVMAEEGRAMADHGRAMAAEVERQRAAGALTPAQADEFVATAEALVSAGEKLQADGERMREEAENLLRSIGR